MTNFNAANDTPVLTGLSKTRDGNTVLKFASKNTWKQFFGITTNVVLGPNPNSLLIGKKSLTSQLKN
jgi:hypothetical protein